MDNTADSKDLEGHGPKRSYKERLPRREKRRRRQHPAGYVYLTVPNDVDTGIFIDEELASLERNNEVIPVGFQPPLNNEEMLLAHPGQDHVIDTETDDGSIFDTHGPEHIAQGRPLVSTFCLNCQNIFDHWPEIIDSFEDIAKTEASDSEGDDFSDQRESSFEKDDQEDGNRLQEGESGGRKYSDEEYPLQSSDELEDEDTSFPHHDTILALQRSAEEGCGLCAQFLQTSQYKRLEEEHQSMMRQVKRRPYRRYRGYVEVDVVWLTGSTDGSTRKCLQLRWRLDKDEIRPDDSPHHDLIPKTMISLAVQIMPALEPGILSYLDPSFLSTRGALPLAKQWFERCCNSHRLCNSFNEHGQNLPTKLISINGGAPHLCLGIELDPDIRYATLSHCWGSAQYLRLTKGNLALFRLGIPSEALSKTFHDAILIAQYLDINYLWIDSLCIIQDGLDDWREQSSLMSDIYGGSFINIAASGAVDGTVGCFISQKPSWRCQLELPVDGEHHIYDCVSATLYGYNLGHTPLGQRGWTLQERILPTRTLHFGSTQVFWECHQETVCEMFPYQIPSTILRANGMYHFEKKPLEMSMWTWIVQRYSHCKLTYKKDKLVALSGLARRIQMQTKEQYVAGLWREGLELQLCWSRAIPALELTRPPYSEYTAPTWSWASMTEPISFRRFDEPSADLLGIRVLRVKITAAGPDPLGQITFASIRLSCVYLFRGVIKTRDSQIASFYVMLGESQFEADIYFDHVRIMGAPLSILPIFGFSGGKNITGLLLQPTGKRRGHYYRVGLFKCNEEESMAFKEASHDHKCLAKDEDYVRIRRDRFGRDHYIITIF